MAVQGVQPFQMFIMVVFLATLVTIWFIVKQKGRNILLLGRFRPISGWQDAFNTDFLGLGVS